MGAGNFKTEVVFFKACFLHFSVFYQFPFEGRKEGKMERWKMEGEKTGMRKRKYMILRPLPYWLCVFSTLADQEAFLHVVHLRISLLIDPNPNAMGGGAAPSPQPPSSFFEFSDVSHPNPPRPSPPQPFFHTHICNYISSLSTYSFVMLCLSISISLVCASRFLERHGGGGGGR